MNRSAIRRITKHPSPPTRTIPLRWHIAMREFVFEGNAMFSHVMLGVNDLEKSKLFYDAVLGTLGLAPGVANKQRYFYRSPTGNFAITKPINGEAACNGNGNTIGFNVDSPEQADAFHAAGVAHGGSSCEDAPGWRESPAGRMYLAYLRDPDGHKICALHRAAK